MNESFSISELARLANVSVRTIRFYIDEGLLPAPDNLGRNTNYDETYLERLELIRQMKAAFLPLKEIRRQISGLDIEEIRRLLANEPYSPATQRSFTPPLSAPSLPAAPAPRPGSAQDYIQKVFKAAAAPQEEPMLHESRPRQVVQPEPNKTEAASHWRRYILFQGVELHVRDPLHPKIAERVEALLIQARRLFKD